jgi:cytoskeletal protein CcmA (bactofilin family)
MVAAVPLTAMAATLTTGEQYSLPADRAVSGNLYVAAGTATVGGRVTGDMFAAGGTIAVSGSVGGDIAAAGGTVQVLGPVDGDVRVIGGTVAVNNRVGGDVVVLGGTAHILPGATVSGDLLVAGGQVIIDGVVNGAVKAVGGSLVVNGTVRGDVMAKVSERLEVGPHALVGGAISYKAPKEAVIAEGASLAGGIEYTPSAFNGFERGEPQRILRAIAGVVTGLQMIAALGLAALMVWRFRRPSLEVLSAVRSEFWPSLGRGIAYLVLVPIAAVLLLISFVGSLPGVLLFTAYGAALVLTKALSGMLFGSVVVMIVRKRRVLDLTWGTALGGVIALKVVAFIPIVGWLVATAATVSVFGVLAHRAQGVLSRR